MQNVHIELILKLFSKFNLELNLIKPEYSGVRRIAPAPLHSKKEECGFYGESNANEVTLKFFHLLYKSYYHTRVSLCFLL